MYTIGAFHKNNNENYMNKEVKVEEKPQLVQEWPSLVDGSVKIEPVIQQPSNKKDWIILTKNNIVEDEKTEDVKKHELLRIIRYNDREVILKKAYLEYMCENENYMRSIYEKITIMNPVYFDKLRSSEKGFLIFSRFIFSKYIFHKNNLKEMRNL